MSRARPGQCQGLSRPCKVVVSAPYARLKKSILPKNYSPRAPTLDHPLERLRLLDRHLALASHISLYEQKGREQDQSVVRVDSTEGLAILGGIMTVKAFTAVRLS